MATLSEATAQLAAWEAASLALATGKSYSIGDRQLSRANADEVRDMMNFWRGEVERLSVSSTNNKPAAIATWNSV